MQPTQAAALLLLGAFTLRVLRLDSPQIPIFDEGLFYIPAAHAYLAGLPDPNFEHPPLGKLAIGAGIGLLGDGTWGWRFPSVFAGTLGIALTHRLARRLSGEPWAGVAAAGLLSAEFLWFEFSRLALLDIFQAVLVLLALNLAPLGWRGGHTLLAGLALGLGTAAKWSAVWVLPALVLAAVVRRYFPRLSKQGGAGVPGAILPAAGLLAGVAAGYALPWLYHLLVLDYTLADVAGLHGRIFAYQRQVGTEHVSTPELLVAPAFWLLNAPLVVTAREDRGVWMLMMSNPFVFWGGVGAALLLGAHALRRKAGFLVLLVAILALYLPWFAIARVKYFYYLLPVIPLLCVAVALAWPLVRARLGQRARLAGVLYFGCAAAAFAGAYPVLTATWPR